MMLDLPAHDIVTLVGITFAAGMVRGFSGFALSAIVMASAALIIPPVQVIPICFFLEMTASLLMIRGGWQAANRKISISLAVASAVGLPLGLAFTTTVAPELSRLTALALIVVLAVLQLARVRMAFLATAPGLYGAGIMAGVATGLASVGGMVVALYVLARQAPAREMRASLVLFLFLSILTSALTYIIFGIMDSTAVLRGLFFAGGVRLTKDLSGLEPAPSEGR
ncbi:MAG: sulfite exporter TauE/SafE family protein, partial [Pseudomonadota bacterium]